jgi:hypothetical protein
MNRGYCYFPHFARAQHLLFAADYEYHFVVGDDGDVNPMAFQQRVQTIGMRVNFSAAFQLDKDNPYYESIVIKVIRNKICQRLEDFLESIIQFLGVYLYWLFGDIALILPILL